MSFMQMVVDKQKFARASMPQQSDFYVAYAEALVAFALMQPETETLKPEIRIGSWQAVHRGGAMYRVTCRNCGLKGIISFSDTRDHRKNCPLCSSLPLDRWQTAGFGALLPEDALRVTKFIPMGISNIDEMPTFEASEDGEGVTEITEETQELAGDGFEQSMELDLDEVEEIEIEPVDDLDEDSDARD